MKRLSKKHKIYLSIGLFIFAVIAFPVEADLPIDSMTAPDPQTGIACWQVGYVPFAAKLLHVDLVYSTAQKCSK